MLGYLLFVCLVSHLLLHSSLAAVLANMIILGWGSRYWRPIAGVLLFLELSVVVVFFAILLLGQQVWTH